jgi:hypothetical protein
MPELLIDRLQSPGPRTILPRDGGGQLGPTSADNLAKLEADPRGRSWTR